MKQAEHPAAALASLPRRRFLRWTLWSGAAVVAVGGGALAVLRRSPLDDTPVPAAIKHLSASEYVLFQRACEVLLPVTGTNLPVPEKQVPVVAHIDAMMALLDAPLRKDVAAGLTLFDNAALVSGWHGKRFVDLDVDTARQYFDRWSQGGEIQRALASLVKRFVYVGYWRDPQTWPAVQFDGPVSERWGLESLGNAPLPADRQEVAS